MTTLHVDKCLHLFYQYNTLKNSVPFKSFQVFLYNSVEHAYWRDIFANTCLNSDPEFPSLSVQPYFSRDCFVLSEISLSLQTEPPFASAQCFFPTTCPPSSSPFLYATTFGRFSMEILLWLCLDLSFLMLFFEGPLLWSQYCSYYRSTAKRGKHF